VKKIYGVIVLMALVVAAAFAFMYWSSTHYSVEIGKVGVVTDPTGEILRVQKGPLMSGEKSMFDFVRYYTVAVQTEEMLSPSTTVTLNNVTVVRVEHGPSGNLKYGAITVDTKDVSNVFINIAVQWHIDVDSADWEDRLKEFSTNYPDENYARETLFNAVRDYARTFAQQFTTDELVYSNRLAYTEGVTAYVQNGLNSLETLNGIIVLDKIFVRTITPPESLQIQYAKVLEAKKQAEATITLANATRDASIQVAVGQSMAINLVANATSDAVLTLQSTGLNTTEAVQYLQLQYVYDSLKKIAEMNPDWKLTIFIDSPEATYTIPVSP
jgi:regulator of protease activity HflC (stomatin/prohibitin superfamily)